ncbi:hypothetical protein ACWA2C_16110 [Priestia megaterium]
MMNIKNVLEVIGAISVEEMDKAYQESVTVLEGQQDVYVPSEVECKIVCQMIISKFADHIGNILGLGHVEVTNHDDDTYMNQSYRKFGEVMMSGAYLQDGTFMPCIDAVNIYYRSFAGIKYPSNDHFIKRILHTVAHELRHVYQIATYEFFDNQLINITNQITFDLPYELRWCEIDADKFAHWFVTGMKGPYQEIDCDYTCTDFYKRKEDNNHTRSYAR